MYQRELAQKFPFMFITVNCKLKAGNYLAKFSPPYNIILLPKTDSIGETLFSRDLLNSVDLLLKAAIKTKRLVKKINKILQLTSIKSNFPSS